MANGWNGSGTCGSATATPTPIKKGGNASPLIKGIVIGAVVVVGAVCVSLLLSKTQKESTDVENTLPSKKIATVVPVRKAPVVEEKKKPAGDPNLKGILKGATLLSVKTNSTGIIMQRYQLANGETLMKRIDPPPVFSNLCDSTIALVVTRRPGERIPPLPPISDEMMRKAFIETIGSPITIEKGDNERVAALKLAVKEIKAAITERIKAGDERSILQMLKDHVQQNNDNIELRAEASAEIKRLHETEGAEFAAEYTKKVNEHLEKMGIRPITGEKKVRPTKKINSESNKGSPL